MVAGGDEKASPDAKSGGAKPRVQNKFKLLVPSFIRTAGLPNVSLRVGSPAFYFKEGKEKKMKKKNFKKAQSIIEYICVTAVFAGVSMAGFALFVQRSSSNYRGQIPTYRDTNTLDGQSLNDGVPNSEYVWSQDWSEPQEKFSGETPNSFVNNPNAHTLPVPNGDGFVDDFFNQYPVAE